MKSYTDIPQSKRLAEFLSPESADMHYKVNRHNNESKIFMIPYSELGYYKDNDYQYSVCAWSLTALLSVLPKQVTLSGSVEDSYWYCKCEDAFNSLFVDSNNPIDACVAMIEKLNELKML